MTIAINLSNASDIGDFNALVAKTKLWLDRGEDLDAYIPTFITLAEAYLNRELRTPEMEAIVSVMPVNGSFALPADFLAMRGLTSCGRPLNTMSPAQLGETYGTLSGWPHAFAISGRTVTVAPTPTTAQAMSLSYWQRIPGLNANNVSNWLITAHPDVYLFGTLAHASGYIDAPDDIDRWTALFGASVESVSAVSNKARWAGPIVARSGVRQVGGGVRA